MPGVGRGAVAGVGAPVDGQRIVTNDVYGAAQAVHRQSLDERVGSFRLAIDQQAVAAGPDEEVEQRLALRGKERSPGGQHFRHVGGDEALQEFGDIFVRIGAGGKPDHGAVEQAAGGHGR